ncbi:UNVERIFIED_CONTAM: hypothetical protein FKN15_011709 [Acipenser sinensis]
MYVFRLQKKIPCINWPLTSKRRPVNNVVLRHMCSDSCWVQQCCLLHQGIRLVLRWTRCCSALAVSGNPRKSWFACFPKQPPPVCKVVSKAPAASKTGTVSCTCQRRLSPQPGSPTPYFTPASSASDTVLPPTRPPEHITKPVLMGQAVSQGPPLSHSERGKAHTPSSPPLRVIAMADRRIPRDCCPLPAVIRMCQTEFLHYTIGTLLIFIASIVAAVNSRGYAGLVAGSEIFRNDKCYSFLNASKHTYDSTNKKCGFSIRPSDL